MAKLFSLIYDNIKSIAWAYVNNAVQFQQRTKHMEMKYKLMNPINPKSLQINTYRKETIKIESET